MTGAVRSLHLAHPGRYRVSVDTPHQDIWLHNPDVVPWDGRGRTIPLGYDLINESHRLDVTFMGAFCHDLATKLGVPVPLAVQRPSLHLTDDERAEKWVEAHKGPYVVLNAGAKRDYTTKRAPARNYQAVIDYFKGRLRFAQIGTAEDDHPRLDGVLDFIGKTSHRQLYSLVWNSIGGIGPVTYLMHVCAALERPYLYVAGGREPHWFTAYPTTITVSTMGLLPCCRTSACWRSRTVPLNDGDEKDRSLCQLPVLCGGETVPRCMELASDPAVLIRHLETLLVHRPT